MHLLGLLLSALHLGPSPVVPRVDDPPPKTSSATRASAAIVLDGRADDLAWKDAAVIDAFRMTDPTEDGEARLRTEARILYDNQHLYVHVRAFDPHPDSIVGLLSRRDVRTQSDHIRVMIDSYHDKRTGFAFVANPAGVQRDIYMFNDGNEDLSWDAVWDVKTVVDTLGWMAEFRIPLGQLRFSSAPAQTFGVMIMREVARYGERYTWPLLRRSRVGLVSQFGDVTGFSSLPAPKRVEVRPYLVERNVTRPVGRLGDRAQQHAAGLDLKYGIGSNLTVDATINPDFGQVEADPAVLNLSAFEQAFSERRPFFLEGAGIFRYDLECNDGSCTGLFYPRRIGRSPQLRGAFGDAGTTANTTILGAAKLTGRLPNGLSVGLLNAMTDREMGTQQRTVEPRTSYAIARAVQEFDQGRSVLGGMITSVNRSVDQWTAPRLRSDAYVMGLDGRKRFAQQRFEVTGFLAASRVSGSADAIAATQLSGAQQFQRPDDALGFDSTRTSLGGWGGEVRLNKNGGGQTRFSSGYRRLSPGFEINDVGFLRRADLQSFNNWFQIQKLKPNRVYRRFSMNLNQWNAWTAEGLPLEVGGNVNVNGELANFWSMYSGIGVDNLAPTFDDRATRGGPAVRKSRSAFGWAGMDMDPRRALVPGMNVFWNRRDDGRSWSMELSPRLTFRGSSRMQGSLSAGFRRGTTADQFVNNYGVIGSDTTHYTVARLDQTTASLTARLDVTASPTLSLQVYAQPFIANGHYHEWRELREARAARWADRWQPYSDSPPGGFTYQQFRSNVVVRWEYRPGSTLFAVWQQGRAQDGEYPGAFEARRDFGALFRSWPDNTFLIKASYWLGR